LRVQGENSKQVVHGRFWDPRSLGLLLFFCIMGILCQLPFMPAGQAQHFQHVIAARLVQAFGALQALR
jgi:hypothetical protein